MQRDLPLGLHLQQDSIALLLQQDSPGLHSQQDPTSLHLDIPEVIIVPNAEQDLPRVVEQGTHK